MPHSNQPSADYPSVSSHTQSAPRPKHPSSTSQSCTTFPPPSPHQRVPQSSHGRQGSSHSRQSGVELRTLATCCCIGARARVRGAAAGRRRVSARRGGWSSGGGRGCGRSGGGAGSAGVGGGSGFGLIRDDGKFRKTGKRGEEGALTDSHVDFVAAFVAFLSLRGGGEGCELLLKEAAGRDALAKGVSPKRREGSEERGGGKIHGGLVDN